MAIQAIITDFLLSISIELSKIDSHYLNTSGDNTKLLRSFKKRYMKNFALSLTYNMKCNNAYT